MTGKLKLLSEKDFHIARKLWHILGVGMIIWLYLSLPFEKALALGCFVTTGVLLFDSLRLYWPNFNSWLQRVFFLIMREGEKKKLTGMSFMTLGALLISILFPKEIVVLSLLFLGIGDPVASSIGIRFGKNKIGSKSLEGTLAAFITCTLISLIYLPIYGNFGHRIWLAVPLAGLWGALSELVQVKYLDDNFTLPLFSSFGLWGLFYVLGG